MKRNRSRKLKRIASTADLLCRSKEEQLGEVLQRLAAARAYAEKLSSLDGTTNLAVSLLPDIWSAQLSKAFSEIARHDAAAQLLTDNLNHSKLRRDKIVDRLRMERSRDQIARREKEVETYVAASLQHRRIRLR